MTMRTAREQWLLELKAALFSRLAGRVMTTRTTGLDGLAKSLINKQSGGPLPPDPELDHPDDWDRPID